MEASGTLERQLVVFDLAGEAYGVDIKAVLEIVRHQEPTPIPSAPPAVDGIINLRGKVIPVIDLRKLLGLQIHPITNDSRIVVVDIHGESMGVVVDAVAEVLRLPSDQIGAAPSTSGSTDSANIDGVVNEDNRLMILLNLERVLSTDSIQNAVVRPEQYVAGAPASPAATETEPELVAATKPTSKASAQPKAAAVSAKQPDVKEAAPTAAALPIDAD